MNQTPAQIAAMKAYEAYLKLSPEDRVATLRSIPHACASCAAYGSAGWDAWNQTWNLCDFLWSSDVYVV